MSTVIRQAEWTERKTVEAVVRGCGKFVRDFFGIRDARAAYDQGQIWLAEVDGVPAGFAYCVLLKRQPVASLHALGTLPQFRGKGLAMKLMKESSAGRPIRLVVDPKNESAVLYYLKRGLQLDYPQPVPTRSGKGLVWRMSGVLR